MGQAGSWGSSGTSATLLRSRRLSALAGFYAWQGQLASVLFGRLVFTQSGAYSVQGQGSTTLVAVAFAMTNPRTVHIPARVRHIGERRLVFHHQSPRQRVLHEPVS